MEDNDTFADIYAEFIERFDTDEGVGPLTDQMTEEHLELISCEDDGNNFWFALAQAQYDCGQLQPAVLKKVKAIIESGADLIVWETLDASLSDLEDRKIALEIFLTKLTSSYKSNRPLRKQPGQEIFKKGDCITFRLKNGNYGGAIVLSEDVGDGDRHYLIAATRIDQPIKPSKRAFTGSEVLIVNFGNWNDQPAITWYVPLRHEQIANRVDVCCQLKVNVSYTLQDSPYGVAADFEEWVVNQIDRQMDYEREHAGPEIRQKVKRYLKSPWYYFGH